ncbi:hypothetical protein TTHERM_00049350 (macronuclear) [Tetrahymena thermophila SB210]|uniref:Uncharacterized protein n=1 Tax=Tetrahymena thermophila (strain SB210) TaxID=312017 RepID=Q23D56_TETTS|nr:hypothetical protein TTHERM_00049350 [Tetrahymena thermophila SB210]EAR94602.2 hypothetical protein TTHERM_00049350 [Tetrahymena thermophila SB210]|eukprot:XP_001014830.2 hypothetical protein TTHERM_00049350 [Tetrahymena thermophila SB210]
MSQSNEQLTQENIDDNKVLITQKEDENEVKHSFDQGNHQDTMDNEISNIQQEIYESILASDNTKQAQQSLLSNEQHSSQTTNNKARHLRDAKQIQKPISTHSFDIQNQSSLSQTSKKKKNSVMTQIDQIQEQEQVVAPFIPKPPLVNHIPITQSSPSLRIYNGGKKKRIKSDKEELQFFRSPYHEKKYLGNKIYPPEPIKIQELPDSAQDLFTYKPHINNPNQQHKSNKGSIFEESKSVDIQFVEYISSPIVVKNSFINNPNCMHNLVNKKNLRQTNNTNFVFQRTINLQENRKNIFTQAQLIQKKNNFKSRSQIFQPPQLETILQNKIIVKQQIKEHEKNVFKVKGQNQIRFSNQGLSNLKAQSQIKLPSFAQSLESMNNFSIAKNNLIKYVNQIKL